MRIFLRFCFSSMIGFTTCIMSVTVVAQAETITAVSENTPQAFIADDLLQENNIEYLVVSTRVVK